MKKLDGKILQLKFLKLLLTLFQNSPAKKGDMISDL